MFGPNLIAVMVDISRYLRIAFSLLVSLCLAMILANLFWGDAQVHYTHRAGMVLFPIFLLFFYLVGFVLAISWLFFWRDLFARQRQKHHPRRTLFGLMVLCVGVGAGSYDSKIGFLAMACLIYWMMTGRISGQPGWSLGNMRQTPWHENLYLAVMVTLVVYAGVAILSRPPDPGAAVPTGTPAFQLEHAHHETPELRRALVRFPDAQSCLQHGADATRRDDLRLMDWGQIETTGEAQVCISRLLHGWGGVSDATEWFSAQGLRSSSSGFNSKQPYEQRDGTLRVTAGWSIKTNGPLFPTTGIIQRILHATPYAMNVDATFSANGIELLFLQVSYSTL